MASSTQSSAFLVLVADTPPVVEHDVLSQPSSCHLESVDTLNLLPHVSILQRPVYTIESRHVTELCRRRSPSDGLLATVGRIATNVMYRCRPLEYNSKVHTFLEQTNAYALVTTAAADRPTPTCVRRRIQSTLDVVLLFGLIDASQHARLSPPTQEPHAFDQLAFLPDIRRVSTSRHSALCLFSRSRIGSTMFRSRPCSCRSLVARWPSRTSSARLSRPSTMPAALDARVVVEARMPFALSKRTTHKVACGQQRCSPRFT